MIKKYSALILAVLSIGLFLGIIAKNQWQLKHSQSLYVELRPVDPRSILQGDYMALRYELYFSNNPASEDLSDRANLSNIYAGIQTYIENKPNILMYVQLDAQQRVVHTVIDPLQLDQTRTIKPLKLKNPSNYVDSLYPSSQSFLFAEGLASCYEQAHYAEFKVDDSGNAILASLRGENLKILGCEQARFWWQGSREQTER